uniref:hypothetical protein n=1 Tax=Paenibacillus phytorum TaxID=2654977 RepID=UPI001FE24EA3|nr:hypothetical protein [Paenibacillus phytorum]
MQSVDLLANTTLVCGGFSNYYVENAITTQDLSYVTKINTDETSAKCGHNYITIFMEPELKNVICVRSGSHCNDGTTNKACW